MRAAVISNGDLGDIKKLKGMLPGFDLVICSDGGVRHLEALGLYPDLIVGDMDSVNPELLNKYVSKGVPVRKVPVMKDETDTELAALAAVELGADKIVLLGALGSRFDHSYANVMVLVKLAQLNIDAMILSSHNRIMVSSKMLILHSAPGSTVSLLPLGENVRIASTKGLYYPVASKAMPLDTPYGISNIFTDEIAEVVIESGWLMAVIAED